MRQTDPIIIGAKLGLIRDPDSCKITIMYTEITLVPQAMLRTDNIPAHEKGFKKAFEKNLSRVHFQDEDLTCSATLDKCFSCISQNSSVIS